MHSTVENRNFNRFSILSDMIEDLSTAGDEINSASPSPTNSLFNLPRKCVERYDPNQLASPIIYTSDDDFDNPAVLENNKIDLYSEDITSAFLASIGACHCFDVLTGREVDDIMLDDHQVLVLSLSESGAEYSDNDKVLCEREVAKEQDHSVAFGSYDCKENYTSILPAPPSTPLSSDFQDNISPTDLRFTTMEKCETSPYPDSNLEEADQQLRFEICPMTPRMECEDLGINPGPHSVSPTKPDPESPNACDDLSLSMSDTLRDLPYAGDEHDEDVDEVSNEVFYTPFQTPITNKILGRILEPPLSSKYPATPSPRRVHFDTQPTIFSTASSRNHNRTSPVRLPRSPGLTGTFPGTYSSPSLRGTPPRLSLRQKYRMPSMRQQCDDAYDSDVENIIEEIERATASYADHTANVTESEGQHCEKVSTKVRAGAGDPSGGILIVLLAFVFGFMMF